MKFKQIPWGFACVVLLCGIATASVDIELRVLVYKDVTVPKGVLEQAHAEAVRVFQGAGIELSWVNCSNNSPAAECQASSAENVLYLKIVSRATSSRDLVYGEAFLDDRGVGGVADLFYDRIEGAHRDLGISEGRLLGAVAAHEIGHLVLGLHSHHWIGIMTPAWDQENLRLLGMGALFFTKEEATRMRNRLCGLDRCMTLTGNQVQERTAIAKPVTER